MTLRGFAFFSVPSAGGAVQLSESTLSIRGIAMFTDNAAPVNGGGGFNVCECFR